MVEYDFPYYISYGKMDNFSSSISFSLSDKNAKRLERSAKQGGRFRLDEDEDIADIFQRVYDAVYTYELNLLLSDSSPLDVLSGSSQEDIKMQAVHYLDSLEIGINYPDELQDLECSVSLKIKQSICESVIVDRSIAEKYIHQKEHSEQIVYVDEGKTLFYIPKNYAGKLIIPSSVKRIEEDVFYNHKKITDISIASGVEEIPDSTFDGCSSLKHIVIPETIKKIGYNTFTNCDTLESVELSEGLVEIDSTAFRFCSNLKELHIPSTVKEISAYIDAYNNGLHHLYFEGLNTTIVNYHQDSWYGMVFHVKQNSEAERFAKQKNISFVYI